MRELADRHGLRIVYDAAHAFGVVHGGRPIATYGDLSVFSFHATKVFHTAEGGAVLGSNAKLFDTLALLRNFAIVNEDEVRGLGVNGKMSEVHAAIGLSVFAAAEAEYQQRATLASRYQERLGGLEGVVFQRKLEDTKHNFGYLAIEVDAEGYGLSRDQVQAALRAENINCRKYFHPLCSENPVYATQPSARPENLPNAHRLASRVLCLPLYGELGADGVDRIARAIEDIQALAPRIRRQLGAA
jgi:dTDP-4-amino-4,6-dideoxygalactose transaminase